MATHQGKQLRLYMRINEITVDAMAEMTGMSRAGIYKWFDKEKLSAENLRTLKDAGVDITSVDSSTQKATGSSTDKADVDLIALLKDAKDRAERAEAMVEKIQQENSNLIEMLKGVLKKSS